MGKLDFGIRRQNPVAKRGIDHRFITSFSIVVLLVSLGHPSRIDAQELSVVATNGQAVPGSADTFGSSVDPVIGGDGTVRFITRTKDTDPMVPGAYDGFFKTPGSSRTGHSHPDAPAVCAIFIPDIALPADRPAGSCAGPVALASRLFPHLLVLFCWIHFS